jgi:tripartite-type tricarboxylate transporter receptor subunit TctC
LDFEEFVGYEGGAPAVQAVASGEIDAALTSTAGAVPPVEEDLVDPVVLTHSSAKEEFPDVSTFDEEGYEPLDNVGRVTGLALLPPGISDERRSTLENAMKNALENDELQDWAADIGGYIEFVPSDEITDRWVESMETVTENIDPEDID